MTETIFESRFRFLDELRKMGANVRVIESTAIITGVDKLVYMVPDVVDKLTALGKEKKAEL